MNSPQAVAVALVAVVCVFISGCSTAETAEPPLPDPGAAFDYQLGGAYPPPPGVSVVVRDRTDRPSGAGYDICYVNGFQTQPADSTPFAQRHPELVVRHRGVPLVDPGWPDEHLYDTSTQAKRTALAARVKPWIDECKSAGYAAVEIDNLDSYTRSGGALSADDNLALATEYAKIAHDAGLAIAQKNTVDQAARLRAVGFDFAIAESCVDNQECAEYSEHYPIVIDIEYTDELGEDAFDSACASATRPAMMILRDHDLVPRGSRGYVYRTCSR